MCDSPQAKLDTLLPLDANDDTVQEKPETASPRGVWFAVGFVVLLISLIAWRIIGSEKENSEPITDSPRENPETKKENPILPPLTEAKDLTNSIGMKFVRIPAGKFLMGSPIDEKDRRDDETQHEVEITKPFYLGVHEVTQEQYERVMGVNPSEFSAEGRKKGVVVGKNTRRYPLENVSWDKAKEFCSKLSAMEEEKKSRRTCRLPTEAEWEYACRGRSATSLTFGLGSGRSLHSSQANLDGNYPYGGAEEGEYLGRPCDVGSYQPNRFGLYDMHGNVKEWCEDYYGPYEISDKRDPLLSIPVTESRRIGDGVRGAWIEGFPRRVFRGGAK